LIGRERHDRALNHYEDSEIDCVTPKGLPAIRRSPSAACKILQPVMLSRAFILKIASFRAVERLVRRSFLFRPLVRRFIAGETLDTAIKISEELAGRGFLISLDFLGENVDNLADATAAKDMYLRMLEAIANSSLAGARPRMAGAVGEPKSQSGDKTIEACNISVKLTQCGFDISDELTERHYREVLSAAARLGNFVRVDMEGSPYTDRTVNLVERLFKESPNTGTVLQAYLYRTPGDVERMISDKIRTRLVKGAYFEPAKIAIQNRKKLEEAYVSLTARLLDAGEYPAIATHNERLVEAAIAHARAKGIDRSRFEFQFIYGVARPLQARLVAEGFNVRIYVPFGSSWYAYFSRRIAERPANAFFVLRSLFRG
jgi:proline dehydrogenase